MRPALPESAKQDVPAKLHLQFTDRGGRGSEWLKERLILANLAVFNRTGGEVDAPSIAPSDRARPMCFEQSHQSLKPLLLVGDIDQIRTGQKTL